MSFLWEKILRPLAFGLDAERAHELGIKALGSGLAAPFYTNESDPIIACERFGLRFASPLGLAAGFDKNGVVVEPMARLGFGFIEVGTVTARPQPGNPRPRLFRLPEDKGLINRLGFNNDGAAAVAARLAAFQTELPVGVNVGRNKDVPNTHAVANYLEAFETLYGVGDYIAINVSSPNTPGLRDLQEEGALGELLAALQDRNRSRDNKPLLLKISPDLNDAELEAVVATAQRHQMSGVIATNTTISRDGLRSEGVEQMGDGGLSGAPLRRRATEVVRRIHSLTAGKLPIIGVGGIFTAVDAFEKIAAGAALIQAYTGFVYGGPRFAAGINSGLARILRERGFRSIDEAVGSDKN